MRISSVCFFIVSLCFAQSNLRSPIRATLPGMSDVNAEEYLPNAHAVTDDGKVPESLSDSFYLIRGMMPWRKSIATTSAQVEFLKNKAKVTDVLIFKDLPNTADGFDAENDVANLIKIYRDSGITGEHISYIPFKWKRIENYFEACEQTLQAIRLMRKIEKEHGRLFFHCTVGEDRTGYLAGLYRVMKDPSNFVSIWKNELCERGYSSGNPNKPPRVRTDVESNLTPLFLKLYSLVLNDGLHLENLDPNLCLKNPRPIEGITTEQLKCEHSSLAIE